MLRSLKKEMLQETYKKYELTKLLENEMFGKGTNIR
jgi:hypothetical protein